ncbi:hypothetical protein GCK32_016688, partial [Trichostrongylus colubriformis]
SPYQLLSLSVPHHWCPLATPYITCKIHGPSFAATRDMNFVTDRHTHTHGQTDILSGLYIVGLFRSMQFCPTLWNGQNAATSREDCENGSLHFYLSFKNLCYQTYVLLFEDWPIFAELLGAPLTLKERTKFANCRGSLQLSANISVRRIWLIPDESVFYGRR